MTHTTETRSRIAAEVRAALARQHKSQRALAAHLGMSATTLSDRMMGRKPFTAEDLMLTADFLDVEDWTKLAA